MVYWTVAAVCGSRPTDQALRLVLGTVCKDWSSSWDGHSSIDIAGADAVSKLDLFRDRITEHERDDSLVETYSCDEAKLFL
jgi:hypothetical protein